MLRHARGPFDGESVPQAVGSRFQGFLARYVVSRRQKGVSFGDDLVLDFAVGTAVHCATGKYIFGLKKSVRQMKRR
jgi:hypothetical protein